MTNKQNKLSGGESYGRNRLW